MIKSEQTSESAAASYRRAGASMPCNRPQQVVVNALAIPLAVIVRHILSDRISELRLAEEYHSTQAFFFDGAHESIGVCVQIRSAWRQMDSSNTLANQGEGLTCQKKSSS